MVPVLERKTRVPISRCDSSGRLGLADALMLCMDMAAEHADVLGIGWKDLTPRHLFWLTVRTRIRLYRRPVLLEEICMRTWPEPARGVRCDRDYRFLAGDEVLLEGKTEWAVIDTATGRPVPMGSVYPPELQEVLRKETVWEEPFSRLRTDLGPEEEYGTYTVRSTDIDVGGHMNNCAYPRAVMGGFSCAERSAMAVSDAEMVFRAPCFEGEALSLRKRNTEEGLAVGLYRAGGDAAFLALLR